MGIAWLKIKMMLLEHSIWYYGTHLLTNSVTEVGSQSETNPTPIHWEATDNFCSKNVLTPINNECFKWVILRKLNL